MTKLLLAMLFLCFSLNSFAQTKELNVDNYENGNLYWRGYDSCIIISRNEHRYKTCHSIGLWEYWYEDGSKMLQTFYVADERRKFINMWLPDGKQILSNGTGYYYWSTPANKWINLIDNYFP